MRFFYDIMMANPWQWPVFYALLLSYAHMLGVLMPAVNVAIALAGVVLKTALRPMYRARWRHILPEDDAHWWGESAAFLEALPLACEQMTSHTAAFWRTNMGVCQDIYHAYEAAWISSVQKTFFFFVLFVCGSYMTSKYVVQTIFKDTYTSGYIYFIIYGGVALACWQAFKSTPTDLF